MFLARHLPAYYSLFQPSFGWENKMIGVHSFRWSSAGRQLCDKHFSEECFTSTGQYEKSSTTFSLFAELLSSLFRFSRDVVQLKHYWLLNNLIKDFNIVILTSCFNKKYINICNLIIALKQFHRDFNETKVQTFYYTWW